MSEKRRGLFNRMFSTNGAEEEPTPEEVARWLNEPDGRPGNRPAGYRPAPPPGSPSPGAMPPGQTPSGPAGLDGSQRRAFSDLAAGFGGGSSVPAWMTDNQSLPQFDDDDDEDGAGVEIAGVGSEGPLAVAGIQEGDVIVAVDGTPVGTEGDLMSALGGLMPGRSAVLEVVRGDQHLTTVVVAPG